MRLRLARQRVNVVPMCPVPPSLQSRDGEFLLDGGAPKEAGYRVFGGVLRVARSSCVGAKLRRVC